MGYNHLIPHRKGCGLSLEVILVILEQNIIRAVRAHRAMRGQHTIRLPHMNCISVIGGTSAIGPSRLPSDRLDVRRRAQMCLACPGVIPESRCKQRFSRGLRGSWQRLARVLGQKADIVVSDDEQVSYRVVFDVLGSGAPIPGHVTGCDRGWPGRALVRSWGVTKRTEYGQPVNWCSAFHMNLID